MKFWLHMIAILWSKVWVFHEGLTAPKIAATYLAIWLIPKVFKKVLYIVVDQGAAELGALKVRPGGVSNPGLPKTGDFNT